MGAGVIIAGGYSTRFGDDDKAVADLAGTPMVRRVADRLAPEIDRLVVNCRAEQAEAIEDALAGYDLPVAFAPDPDTDRGPTFGIMTGLRAVDAEYAVVVACDMPFVDPAFVAYLFDRADGHDAAVPKTDEWYQPTQAVYRADAMADACERALASDDHRIIAPLDHLDWVEVSQADVETHADPDTFRNVNTRAELAAAADDLS